MTKRSRHRRSSSKHPRRLLAIGITVFALVAATGVMAMIGSLGANGEPEPQLLQMDSQTASAAGVVVTNPSADLGRVPLDIPVGHSFVVRNTNSAPVELGVPAIEVLDGC